MKVMLFRDVRDLASDGKGSSYFGGGGVGVFGASNLNINVKNNHNHLFNTLSFGKAT